MELSRALFEEGVEYLRQYNLHFAHLYVQTSTFHSSPHDLSSLHITPHDFTAHDDTRLDEFSGVNVSMFCVLAATGTITDAFHSAKSSKSNA